MSIHPCCRINRGKIHYEDTKETENKISDHPYCRINRGQINRVLLYKNLRQGEDFAWGLRGQLRIRLVYKIHIVFSLPQTYMPSLKMY